MQGANRQISERRPPNRGNSACIGKAKPTKSISDFVHETSRAHTFASGDTKTGKKTPGEPGHKDRYCIVEPVFGGLWARNVSIGRSAVVAARRARDSRV